MLLLSSLAIEHARDLILRQSSLLSVEVELSSELEASLRNRLSTTSALGGLVGWLVGWYSFFV
jgi:hypothetical protein